MSNTDISKFKQEFSVFVKEQQDKYKKDETSIDKDPLSLIFEEIDRARKEMLQRLKEIQQSIDIKD
ncbi:hypothetical protein FMM56_02290 [Campylobacter sp. LR264d]|uniref:nitric oxide synthase oxygenase n=1 Tax=Campylobacter sp. LR264d TaxID=2593544 RepID=UPI00123AA7CB|nr:nitric oxide synthase oxygenase [Campylobacter sp. LR264d]KAA6233757.1 hypothetical protein FMM56_02290 [Campylobacter sp. LR264d]